jgi:hypothetical protein
MRVTLAAKISVGLVGAALLLHSQRLTWYERLILLPKEQTVAGIVVDADGNPVAGAHIDHSDVREQESLFTDDQGRFKVRTRAPAVVIRKLGFDGALIKTGPVGPLRVVLRTATGSMPACHDKCVGLANAKSIFCFAPVAGVEVHGQGRMGESTSRAFLIATRDGPREILLGSGPMWSLGIPYTGDVWESTEYAERSFAIGESEIIDARGKTVDGKIWRYLGRFGESASYYEVDARDAAVADRFLDGACIGGNKEKAMN